MRISNLAWVLHGLAAVQRARALPHQDAGAEDYDLELVDAHVPLNLTERNFTPEAILGKLAQDLIMSTVASVFAGHILNAVGGASNVVEMSEQTLGRIANLVSKQIEDAWFARDKADSRTFLQIASNYDRRGAYNLTHPNPAHFSNIDQDRVLAHDYANIAQGLLNRINLYGLKGAPLYQVLVGTWVAFRKEQILLSQALDNINSLNNEQTTMAATARASFRGDCQAMRNALIKYQDEFDKSTPRLYFHIQESRVTVSAHMISCRQTVERWVSVQAYKTAQYSDADRASVSVRDWDRDYYRISGRCRMNKCNPSSAATTCWEGWRDWADDWQKFAREDWRVKKRGDFLTNHIDANIASLQGIHNGTISV